MTCMQEPLVGILPAWLRHEVENTGLHHLQELRLRVNAPPQLCLDTRKIWLTRQVTGEDLMFCVNTASRYSPWAASTIGQGYLTIRGGHRLGLCGEAVCKDGVVTGIREVRSLNIRVARDYVGISKDIRPTGSLLILGAPGWGKTTLLRDLVRRLSETANVSVVDERGELFPEGFSPGRQLDVLTGCPKGQGIDMVLRTMGPDWIAVDEITAAGDTDALLQAVGCGVKLIASAHASSLQDLRQRPIYKPLLDYGIFHSMVILRPDKSYWQERTGL